MNDKTLLIISFLLRVAVICSGTEGKGSTCGPRSNRRSYIFPLYLIESEFLTCTDLGTMSIQYFHVMALLTKP